MHSYFPGTLVDRENRTSKEFLFGIFSISNGVMLSHIREITGLDTPLLQNWVARGYVPRPVNKRYSINHLARILLINMLRDILKIEDIMNLLTYIMYDKTVSKDCVINESEIYNHICYLLDIVDYDTVLSHDGLRKIIINTLTNNSEKNLVAIDSITNGLEIILVYYASVIVKNKADKLIKNYIRV